MKTGQPESRSFLLCLGVFSLAAALKGDLELPAAEDETPSTFSLVFFSRGVPNTGPDDLERESEEGVPAKLCGTHKQTEEYQAAASMKRPQDLRHRETK